VNESDIFERTKGAYLCLVHPSLPCDAYRQEISPVIALAPAMSDPLIVDLIKHAGWRERILGICIGMAKHPVTFIDPILQSLKNPRGIAIVPACAALAVLARRGSFAMTRSFSDAFERTAFDGEVGWAMDKAMHFAKLRSEDVQGRGPNYGQSFEDHVAVYDWILSRVTSQ
jgi:hypothetical protein